MASKRRLADDELCNFFAQEKEDGADFPLESGSELEDYLSEDDVQSDLEEEFVDLQSAENLENEPSHESPDNSHSTCDDR